MPWWRTRDFAHAESQARVTVAAVVPKSCRPGCSFLADSGGAEPGRVFRPLRECSGHSAEPELSSYVAHYKSDPRRNLCPAWHLDCSAGRFEQAPWFPTSTRQERLLICVSLRGVLLKPRL